MANWESTPVELLNANKDNGERSALDLPSSQKTMSRGDSYTVSDAELLDYYFDSLAYSVLSDSRSTRREPPGAG